MSAVEPRARYDDERAFNPTPDSSYGKLLGLVPEGAAVLDVGCSYGGFADALRRLKGARVTGVEMDPVAADQARPRCEALFVGDVAKLLPGLPRDFDVIVAADVLEHLVDPRPVLEGLARLLRPGGFLIASIPNVTHLSVVLALANGRFPRSREGLLDATHLQFYGEGDVRDLFHGAGYAARVVDRVRIDPRLTEFHTDVSGLPDEIFGWFDRNPNADTYQFIVRAVPRAWARPEDDESEAAASADGGKIAGRLAAEVTDLHLRLRTYHEALTQRLEEDAQMRQKLASAGEAAEANARALEAASARTEDVLEIARNRREAKRLHESGALSAEEKRGLRVLFVADRDDAPFRYRCVHACDQLRASGVAANIRRLDHPALVDEIAAYSVVVLFRLAWSDRVAEVAAAARRSGARLVFDIDDLLFDPGLEQQIPFLRRCDAQTLSAYRAQFSGLRATLENCDVCTAATPTIARHARRLGKPAVVHPNLVSRFHLRLASVAARARRRLAREPVFGYLSGSNTHDGDLESIAGAFLEVLSRIPDARLLVCGIASVPAALNPVRARIVSVPYLDYRLYPWLMTRCRAVVAPLEEITEFADAKSALKVIEAGAFAVPAVASPSLPYSAAIDHGVSGFVARTQAEWVEALLHLADMQNSLRAGAAAREIALRDHSADAYAHVLGRSLLGMRGTASGPPPELLPLPETGFLPAKDRARHLRTAWLLATSRADDIGEGIAHEAPRSEEEKAAAASVFLLACTRREGLLELDGEIVGASLADRERPLGSFPHNVQVEELPGITPGCRFRSLGDDPGFQLGAIPPGSPPFRYLLLEMRAVADGESASAQLFWESSPRRPFRERKSLRIPLVADGQLRTYLVDLHRVLGRALPLRPGRLRFDPVERPCEFEVATVALLSRCEGSVDVRQALARRFLRGEGIEIGALQNPLAVPSQALVRYVDRLDVPAMRAAYPELDGQRLVAPVIRADAEKLESVPSESQDFVICNHVLEHMRDPLGALRQWQRVLKPGGVLYLAIPDRTNVLDRERDVTTFQHLLEDEAAGGRKGTEVDRFAFSDFVRSAHPEMSEEQRASFVKGLVETDYSIHFHVFDRALFERVLLHACGGSRVLALAGNAPGGQLEHIAILRKESAPERRPAAIVIPIYNARDFTRKCVESVSKHAPADARIVLVDDASTDPGIGEDLREFARDDRIVVLRNEKNEGFVKTANRGMREAQGRDVLLLNSDTEVFPGFFGRLRDAAYGRPRTGIVTPFSNNATIFSLPSFGENPIPEGHSAASMAALVAGATRRLRPLMPTAVGFCMYIRGEVLERVGLFDEEAFGRGFGEENDLCERALEAGFEIRLADDVFVWHKGKASFGAEGLALERKNSQVLRERHPRYEPAVSKFCTTNPIAPLQAEIAFHIPRLREGARGAALFLVHASPYAANAGGTEHHVSGLLRALELPRAVLLHPEGAEVVASEVLRGDVQGARRIRFRLSQPTERFCVESGEAARLVRRIVDLFGIRWAHLHHLLFWPAGLGRTLREAGIPYVLTAHDYYAVCPSWNLFDYGTGARCQCSHRSPLEGPGCLPALFREASAPPVDYAALRVAHRAAFDQTLRGAEAIVVPSRAALQVLGGELAMDPRRLHVIPHPADPADGAARAPRGTRLRVALLGEIAYALKGSANYLELLERARAAAVEWHVFGDVAKFGFAEALRDLSLGDRLVLHGAYDRGAIVRLLREHGIDLCVFLPAVDETFSFTLSESFSAGIPALVLARGALPERVEASKGGFVVRTVAEAAEHVASLAADPARLAAPEEHLRSYRPEGSREVAARYRELYRSVGFDLSPDAGLRPEWLHEISERAGVLPAPLAMPPEPVRLDPGAPAPSAYAGRVWYPLVRRVKPFVPRSARDLLRTGLRRFENPPLLTLRARRASLHSLSIEATTLVSTTFTALTNDPQMEFRDFRPFDPGTVAQLRFSMRRRDRGFAQAQLFWTHDPASGFSEALSATVDLDGKPGEWRDYAILLEADGVRASWLAGPRIERLRFDPLSAAGVFDLGPLEFVRRRPDTPVMSKPPAPPEAHGAPGA